MHPLNIKLIVYKLLPVFMIAMGFLYLTIEREVAAKSAADSLRSATTLATERETGVPYLVRIAISNVGIDLPVISGGFNQDSGVWTLDNGGAFSIINSKTPIVYGHASDKVFKRLEDVTVGDILIVTYDDGSKKMMKYTDTKLVRPSDISVLSSEDIDTVILLTCAGVFDEMRRLVYFKEAS